MAHYEAPTVTELGSVAELTRGDGWNGDHDSVSFTIWGHDITISWGTS